MLYELGILVPLSAVLRRLIDDIGFLSIVNASSFGRMLFNIASHRSDELHWSVVDLHDDSCSTTLRMVVFIRFHKRWYPVASMLLNTASPTGTPAWDQVVTAMGLL